jgi:carbonic anhydrase
MDHPQRFLLENLAWADEMQGRDPRFFERMTGGQQPGVFWIGCSDSRVPAERITNAGPGELFVHRGIANMALPDDLNVMSALQYAVQTLGVAHVIVCGHDGCGGVRGGLLAALAQDAAAKDAPGHGALEAAPDVAAGDYLGARIRPIARLYRQHRAEVDRPAGEGVGAEGAETEDQALARRVDRLVMVNVEAQVRHLAATAVVRDAWAAGRPLRLHGWVYGLGDGRLREVIELPPAGASVGMPPAMSSAAPPTEAVAA